MTMSGSPNRVSPLPNLVISHEDYTLLERLIQRRRARRASRPRSRTGSARARCSSGTPWRRSRAASKPGQVVILGAHLDSWDLGTGTTDNGTGSMAVLEAARVHRAVRRQAEADDSLHPVQR